MPATHAATTLAIAIEQARDAIARGNTVPAESRSAFVGALTQMIRDAVCREPGDPAVSAMVLAHREHCVREYASLLAHAVQDRRSVLACVDAIAHPARLQRMPAGPQRDELAALHEAAASQAWHTLHDRVGQLLAGPSGAPLAPRLTTLRDSAPLQRLVRIEALCADENVREYRSLLDQQRPRAGSVHALADGGRAKQRGAAMEARTAAALATLAQRLDKADRVTGRYRVATSMRVPAALCNGAQRAKAEWDAVLLERADDREDDRADDRTKAPLWHVRLLAEAKASVDAASTDLRRLLRGLRVLANADEHAVYPFATDVATVRISGASLRALDPGAADLHNIVLYCCDARVEPAPRVLGAASRMQLLSSPHALDFAAALARGAQPDATALEALWHELLEQPKWRAVLDQYPTLQRVRELMVHPEDLIAAIDSAAAHGVPR